MSQLLVGVLAALALSSAACDTTKTTDAPVSNELRAPAIKPIAPVGRGGQNDDGVKPVAPGIKPIAPFARGGQNDDGVKPVVPGLKPIAPITRGGQNDDGVKVAPPKP